MDLTPRGDIILCPERSATLDQIATDVLVEEAQAKAATDAVREKARAKAAFAAAVASSSASTKRAYTTKRSKINRSSGLKSSGESSWFWDKFVLPEEEIKPVQTEETEDESVSGSEDEYEHQDDHSVDVHDPAAETNNATYAVESSEAQDLAESKPAKSKIIPPSRVGRFRSFLSLSQKKNKKAKGGSRPAQGNFLTVAPRPAPSPVKKQSPGPLGKLFTCGRQADSLDGYSCASDSTANWVPKLKWCNSCAIHCCVIYTD